MLTEIILQIIKNNKKLFFFSIFLSCFRSLFTVILIFQLSIIITNTNIKSMIFLCLTIVGIIILDIYSKKVLRKLEFNIIQYFNNIIERHIQEKKKIKIHFYIEKMENVMLSIINILNIILSLIIPKFFLLIFFGIEFLIFNFRIFIFYLITLFYTLHKIIKLSSSDFYKNDVLKILNKTIKTEIINSINNINIIDSLKTISSLKFLFDSQNDKIKNNISEIIYFEMIFFLLFSYYEYSNKRLKMFAGCLFEGKNAYETLNSLYVIFLNFFTTLYETEKNLSLLSEISKKSTRILRKHAYMIINNNILKENNIYFIYSKNLSFLINPNNILNLKKNSNYTLDELNNIIFIYEKNIKKINNKYINNLFLHFKKIYNLDKFEEPLEIHDINIMFNILINGVITIFNLDFSSKNIKLLKIIYEILKKNITFYKIIIFYSSDKKFLLEMEQNIISI